MDGGADGTGIPLTCSTHSTERDGVKLASETVDQARYQEFPTPLVADKGYDNDELRDELADKTFYLFPRIDKIANDNLARIAEGCAATRADGSSKERFPGSDDFAKWLYATNTIVESINILYT